MKNFVEAGDTLTLAAPTGGVVSGNAYLIGALFGVAVVTAAEAVPFALKRTGVFVLPKVTGTAWTEGMPLYWDDTAKKVTAVAAGNRPIGAAAAAALSADTTGSVLLVPAGEGLRAVGGQHTTIDADDTVVTGLASVLSVVAQLDDDPVDGAMHVTATKGDQAGAPAAGSIQIKTWKSTDGDATLIAATTFSKKVNWIAIGT